VVGAETLATILRPSLTLRQRAIVGLALNGLICPGAGTLYAGERRKGIIQIALALVSLVVIIVAGVLPVLGSSLLVTAVLMVVGALIFGVVWLWSLVISIKQIQSVRT
jgi:TM2 domain-containing membrane protein YozV